MKTLCLKFFILGGLLLLTIPLFGEPLKGYIITRDNKKITGTVHSIYYSSLGCIINFKNDFGTNYIYSPIVIKAFVMEGKEQTTMYVSKYHKKRWYFLKVESSGAEVNLYRSPEFKNTAGNMWNTYKDVVRQVEEFWIEVNKKNKIVRIYSSRYKKILKKTLSNYPLVSNKLGEEGYKMKDIKKIVAEVNEIYNSNVKKI